MYQGKHVSGAKRTPQRKRRLRWRKEFVLLCSVAALLTGFVGSTVAYLFTSTEEIENKFTPSSVTSEIEEDFDGNVKSDVKVKNTGDIPAYIRAKYVVTWQDDEGNVYGQLPVAGEDYSITLTLDGWDVGSDGYYYWTSSVPVGDTTGILIDVCKPLKAAPAEGYTLSVEILAEAIQAEPSSVVAEAWGVTVAADGTISK